MRTLTRVLCDVSGSRARDGHATDGIYRSNEILWRDIELVAAPRSAEVVVVAVNLVDNLLRTQANDHGEDRVSEDNRLFMCMLMRMSVGGHGLIALSHQMAELRLLARLT